MDASVLGVKSVTWSNDSASANTAFIPSFAFLIRFCLMTGAVKLLTTASNVHDTTAYSARMTPSFIIEPTELDSVFSSLILPPPLLQKRPLILQSAYQIPA